jgi:hypothetical protein
MTQAWYNTNMSNSPQAVQDIIKQKPYLAWFTSQYNQLSDQAVLEQVLNYGDWDDVKTFIRIRGMTKTAQLFKESISGPRDNYKPIFKHYFTKFFRYHAPECFKSDDKNQS